MNKVLTRNCAGDGQVHLEAKQRDSAVHTKEIERGRDSERVQTVPAEISSPVAFRDNWTISNNCVVSLANPMARFFVSGETSSRGAVLCWESSLNLE